MSGWRFGVCDSFVHVVNIYRIMFNIPLQSMRISKRLSPRKPAPSAVHLVKSPIKAQTPSATTTTPRRRGRPPGTRIPYIFFAFLCSNQYFGSILLLLLSQSCNSCRSECTIYLFLWRGSHANGWTLRVRCCTTYGEWCTLIRWSTSISYTYTYIRFSSVLCKLQHIRQPIWTSDIIQCTKLTKHC